MKLVKDKNLAESIRTRLEDAINSSGMKKSKIAEDVKISRATLSDYLHKKKLPSIETFAVLCDVLDVSSDEILGLK